MSDALRLKLQPGVEHGEYSNVAYVSFTENEFALDFGIMVGAMSEVDIFKRVLIAPWQFKKLVHVLAKSLENFEANIAVIHQPGTVINMPISTSTKDPPS